MFHCYRSDRVHLVAKRNAHCERVIGSVKRECLDHFVVFGEDHLRYILNSYIAHYLEDRPHQGVGNVPLPVANGEAPAVVPFPSGEVVCHERLGGLLKSYRRKAA